MADPAGRLGRAWSDGGDPVRHATWLTQLQVGDRVLAGAGFHAELRSTPRDPAADKCGVVVRCLNRAEDGTWWGYHHSRVPVSTLKPWVE